MNNVIYNILLPESKVLIKNQSQQNCLSFQEIWNIFQNSLSFPGSPWVSQKTLFFPGFPGLSEPCKISELEIVHSLVRRQKGNLKKRCLLENKSNKIFWKTNVSYLLIWIGQWNCYYQLGAWKKFQRIIGKLWYSVFL